MSWSFPGGTVTENPPANEAIAEDEGSILGQEDPLEEELATRSRILARITPWTENHVGL